MCTVFSGWLPDQPSYAQPSADRQAPASFVQQTGQSSDAPLRTDKKSVPRAIALYRNAAALQERKLYDLAAAEWKELIADHARDPLAPQARHQCALCLFQLQQYADSAKLFEQVLQEGAPPELLSEARLNLGLANYNLARAARRGDATAYFDRAAEALGNLIKETPKSDLVPQALFYQAEALYGLDRKREAAAAYQSLVSQFPDHPRCRDAKYGRGVTLQEIGDTSASARAFADFLAAYPDDPLVSEVELRRGESLAASESWESAFAAYGKAAVDPKFAHADYALYQQASAAEQLGNLPQAAQLFAKLAKTFPQSAYRSSALVASGRCEVMRKQYEQAISQLVPAWQDPTQLDRQTFIAASYWLARAYLDSNDSQNAATTIQRSLQHLAGAESANAADQQSVASPRLVPILAEAYLQQGKPADAFSQLRSLVSSAPSHPDWSYWVVRAGQATILDQDWQQTVTFLSPHMPHLQRVADRTRAAVLLARAHLQSGNPQLAIDALSKHADPAAEPQVYLLLATAHRALGAHGQVLEQASAFLSGTEAGPSTPHALFLRGWAQAHLQQFEQAETSFRTILKDHASYRHLDRVLYELAWALDEAKEPRRAEEAYTRLANEFSGSPLAPEAWYRLAERAYQRDDYAAAIQGFKNVTRAPTSESLLERAYHQLGWCHYQRGDYAEASQAFAAQTEYFPEGSLAADARTMAGESYFKLNDFARASELLSHPDQESVSATLRPLSLLHLGQSLAQQQKWEASLAPLDRLLVAFPDSPLLEEAKFEKGSALFQLDRLAEARVLFEGVAQQPGVLGARAQFMAGEVLFAKKDYEQAVRTFFKVAYGYGDRGAPVEYHQWQSEAMFEAARCLQLTRRDEAAQQVYEELLERFPKSTKAEHARIKLSEMNR